MSSSRTSPGGRRSARLSGALAAFAVAAALTGCGSASPAASTNGTSSQVQVASLDGAASTTHGSGRNHSSRHGSPAARSGTSRVAARSGRTRIATRPNGAAAGDPVQTSGRVQRSWRPKGLGVEAISEAPTPTLNPCRLVSGRQAARIMRASAVSVQTAPQGPTCLYTASGRGGPTVTLAVTSVGGGRAIRAGRVLGHLTVDSRRAVCVRLGQTSLHAPLPSGATLVVTAPCITAARFASLALPHLAPAGK